MTSWERHGAGTHDGYGLTEAGLRTLGAIVERLIPSDEHGPGAGEANVVEYIERALATDYHEHVPVYQAGLDLLDENSTLAYDQPFADLSAERQDDLLAGLEAESSRFFELVLQHTREGMFGDPAWGGNAGRVGWTLVGYPGPRHVWTPDEQRLG